MPDLFPTPTPVPPAKPGYKTTEFWLSLAAVLLGAFVSSGILPDTHWGVKIAGIVLAGLGALGYTKFRTDAKASALIALFATGLIIGGCATAGSGSLSTLQRIDKAQKGVDAVAALAVPGFRIAIKRSIEDCVSRGVTTPADCPVYQQLIKARELVVAGIKGAYLAIQKATTLDAVGRPGDAAAALSLAEEALRGAIDVLYRSGIMTAIEGVL